MVPAGWCLATPLQPDRLQTGKKPQSPGKQKTRKRRKINASGSRSGGIRTRGLLVPNQTRYQTALHLDTGADEGTRTPDLLITNRLLYQLSHIGTTSKRYYNKGNMVCPALFFIPGGHPDACVINCSKTGREMRRHEESNRGMHREAPPRDFHRSAAGRRMERSPDLPDPDQL